MTEKRSTLDQHCRARGWRGDIPIPYHSHHFNIIERLRIAIVQCVQVINCDGDMDDNGQPAANPHGDEDEMGVIAALMANLLYGSLRCAPLETTLSSEREGERAWQAASNPLAY